MGGDAHGDYPKVVFPSISPISLIDGSRLVQVYNAHDLLQPWGGDNVIAQCLYPEHQLVEPGAQGVWSPAGGWYADPKHWRRNTAFAILGTVVVGAFIFKQSLKLEQRHSAPAHWIPSQMWNNKNIPEKRPDALGGAT